MKHGLIVIVLLFGLLVGSAFAALPDSDNDGVPDLQDVCPTGTRLKELVPAASLGTNRFALTNGDRVFDTTPSKGKGPQNQYSVDGSVGSSTCGCSCEQILAFSPGEKTGLFKSGCTIGIMDNFVNSRCLPDKDNDGYTVSRGDCNDNNPAISPGAVEACNGVDDDCDGAVDDGIAPVAITCGTGACAGTGQQVCVNGQLQSQCTPKPAGTACGAPGSVCQNADTCDANGQCQTGIPVDCNDDNACTNDACNPILGCVHLPVTCDDGIDCTVETCDQATGQCVSTPDDGACPSADRCHLGSCDGTLGCVQEPVDCDDDDPCTDDTCNALLGGCVHIPVTCDDGIDCTAESCDALTGQCVSTPDDNACPGEDQCHVGSCVVGQGCIQESISCDDNNPCTRDTCNPIMGCVHLQETCDDNNPCTTDSCDIAAGCQHRQAPAGTSCDDGYACTTHDQCNGNGQCQAGSELYCDDNNECTDDACDPATGCIFMAAQAFTLCDDGDDCTTRDQCDMNGQCTGLPLTCDDGNSCTADSCDPSSGCAHSSLQDLAACDDNDACTMNDACQAGTCSGLPVSCEDYNANSYDSCDSQTGCYHLWPVEEQVPQDQPPDVECPGCYDE